MAEVGHVVFQSNTTQTTASTTPVTAYTIASAASLDTSGTAEYILIVNALVGGDTASNNRREFEIHDNGTVIADTYQRIEPESGTDGVGNHYGLVKRFTKASAGDITFEHYNTDAVNTRTYACEAILILLDDLVEGTDYLHDVDTVLDSNVASYTDGASVTVPADAAEKWLAFGHVQWRIDTIGEIHSMKIVDDVTDRAEILWEAEDANETQCMMTTYPINGAGSTKTVKIQYDSNGTGDMLASELFLLRLGVFKNSDFAEGGTATVTAADTWAELETLTGFTANHTGDHCMMGGGIVADADNLNHRERRLTSQIGAAGEVTQAGSATRQLAGNGAATEDLPVFIVGSASFTDSDSLNFDLDVGDSVNNTNESWSAGWVSAFTFELAATGTTIPDGIGRGIARGIGRGIG